MHLHDNPEAKKILWVLIIIVIIVFVFLSLSGGQQSKPNQSTQIDPRACAINFVSTFIFNVPSKTSQTTVARALLTQFLDQYKNLTNCMTLGITDYSITSIGKVTDTGKDFTVPATFDVLPRFKDQTQWGLSSGTTWDGDWVRGESVTLGIMDSSTTTSKSYRLVLQ